MYYIVYMEKRIKPKIVSIRIDDDLVRMLEYDSRKYRTSMSEIIRMILLKEYNLIENMLFKPTTKKMS